MKKTLIYILAAAAVLGACSREPMDNPGGIPSDHSGITLTPVCSRPGTKADTTTPGDPTYNENTIADYFWFIYGDAAGTDLRVCGHETGSSSKNINLDEEFPTGGTGYAYVVANLPSDKFTYVAAEGTSKGGIQYEGTVYSTLSEIQSLPIELSFYNATSATTGTVAPGNFVMRTSAPVSFELAERTNVRVTASLARVSIKIVLDLKVAQEINQSETTAAGLENYKKTWIADVDHIQAYMLWGSTHSTVAGTPIEYGDETKDGFYSASPRYAMYGYDVQNGKYAESGYNYDLGGYWNGSSVDGNAVNAKGNGQTLQIPTSVWKVAYKVKQDENNEPIWIWNTGTAAADQTDDNIGNLSLGDWDYELKDGQKQELLDEDGNVMRYLAKENVERKYWMLSSTPLYTTPISWDVNGAHAPYIKIILPWQGCKRANEGTGDITEQDSKTTEFYYKILIPNRTTLEANNYYRIQLDLSVLGSEADDVPVEVSGTYHVVDWNNVPQEMGGDLQAGRYLNCETSFAFYSQNSMPISVSSSHEIEVVSSSATYQNYSGTTVTTATLPASTYTITATGNSLVTINHTMETDLSKMHNYDVSPITYTITIQHKGDGGSDYQKTITVIQYPPMYIEPEASNGYVYVNGYYNTSRYGASTNNTTYWAFDDNKPNNPSPRYPQESYVLGSVTGLNNLGSGTNSNPNMYKVKVSSLSGTNYILGDAREKVKTLSYLQLNGHYRPGDSSDQARNMISPYFMVSSAYSKTILKITDYERVEKRCAAFQEAGYPAGRWRVPTEGEIEFMVNLSDNGLIPSLFMGCPYWASSGRLYNPDSKAFIEANTPTAQDDNGVRCVYDLWYWGDKEPSETEKTTWQGFKD